MFRDHSEPIKEIRDQREREQYRLVPTLSDWPTQTNKHKHCDAVTVHPGICWVFILASCSQNVNIYWLMWAENAKRSDKMLIWSFRDLFCHMHRAHSGGTEMVRAHCTVTHARAHTQDGIKGKTCPAQWAVSVANHQKNNIKVTTCWYRKGSTVTCKCLDCVCVCVSAAPPPTPHPHPEAVGEAACTRWLQVCSSVSARMVRIRIWFEIPPPELSHTNPRTHGPQSM